MDRAGAVPAGAAQAQRPRFADLREPVRIGLMCPDHTGGVLEVVTQNRLGARRRERGVYADGALIRDRLHAAEVRAAHDQGCAGPEGTRAAHHTILARNAANLAATAPLPWPYD